MGEKLSALLVVVLVLSCFACASCIQGIILSRTLVQQGPGEGQRVLTTLLPENVVDVNCRTQDVVVFDDPWWLKVIYTPPAGNTTTGWVADYYVDCGNVGNCNVSQCA